MEIALASLQGPGATSMCQMWLMLSALYCLFLKNTSIRENMGELKFLNSTLLAKKKLTIFHLPKRLQNQWVKNSSTTWWISTVLDLDMISDMQCLEEFCGIWVGYQKQIWISELMSSSNGWMQT